MIKLALIPKIRVFNIEVNELVNHTNGLKDKTTSSFQ